MVVFGIDTATIFRIAIIVIDLVFMFVLWVIGLSIWEKMRKYVISKYDVDIKNSNSIDFRARKKLGYLKDSDDYIKQLYEQYDRFGFCLLRFFIFVFAPVVFITQILPNM
jgi:hypothetical protein